MTSLKLKKKSVNSLHKWFFKGIGSSNSKYTKELEVILDITNSQYESLNRALNEECSLVSSTKSTMNEKSTMEYMLVEKEKSTTFVDFSSKLGLYNTNLEGYFGGRGGAIRQVGYI